MSLSGIEQSKNNVKDTTTVLIQSRYNDFSSTLNCVVLLVIIEKLPQVKLNLKALRIPHILI